MLIPSANPAFLSQASLLVCQCCILAVTCKGILLKTESQGKPDLYWQVQYKEIQVNSAASLYSSMDTFENVIKLWTLSPGKCTHISPIQVLHNWAWFCSASEIWWVQGSTQNAHTFLTMERGSQMEMHLWIPRVCVWSMDLRLGSPALQKIENVAGPWEYQEEFLPLFVGGSKNARCKRFCYLNYYP